MAEPNERDEDLLDDLRELRSAGPYMGDELAMPREAARARLDAYREEIEAPLKAEVERLNRQCRDSIKGLQDAGADIVRLTAEVERLRARAARWKSGAKALWACFAGWYARWKEMLRSREEWKAKAEANSAAVNALEVIEREGLLLSYLHIEDRLSHVNVFRSTMEDRDFGHGPTIVAAVEDYLGKIPGRIDAPEAWAIVRTQNIKPGRRQ